MALQTLLNQSSSVIALLQNSDVLVEDLWLWIMSTQKQSCRPACVPATSPVTSHLLPVAHTPIFRLCVWTSTTVYIVLKKSCDMQHEPLLASAGSLSAVRGHQGAARSLHREQSDANAESSAIVFLGDHQVKLPHIAGSS